jgi:hypothetical protein
MLELGARGELLVRRIPRGCCRRSACCPTWPMRWAGARIGETLVGLAAWPVFINIMAQVVWLVAWRAIRAGTTGCPFATSHLRAHHDHRRVLGVDSRCGERTAGTQQLVIFGFLPATAF